MSSLLIKRSWLVLAAITALGGCLRFYGLAKGAPYHHFHIDEHFVFVGADLLRDSISRAAQNPKFFMYGPLPMYLVNGARALYEWFAGPLNLSATSDGVVYMVLGRSVSALLGTATIPLVFAIARRVAGRLAGLVAAALMACAVLHLRDSHFFTVDASLVFFCVVTWAASLAIADQGRRSAYVLAGVGLGAAVACKYTGVFLVPVLAVAHVCSPSRPRTIKPAGAWLRWSVQGALPLLIGAAVFLLLDPMVILFNGKFLQDVREQITDPLLGGSQPLWNANFRDVQPQLYWFTNLLPWGIGPALMAWGVAGVAWLATRRTRLATATAAYPLFHFAVAGQTLTPFIRYTLPLIPGLAVAAGIFSADLIARPRWRWAGLAGTAAVLALTAGYAAAYLHVYAAPDVRLEAARVLLDTVPQGASILVEPSHNTPPTGRYLTAPDFYRDYVGWGANTIRRDYYVLRTLDVYEYLYDTNIREGAKRDYIDRRLAASDYILMDDTFLELYEHLAGPEYQVVREYYRDLFGGRLGFELVYQRQHEPSLFGWAIDDERAEFTFTLFDHPDIYLFKRTRDRLPVTPSVGVPPLDPPTAAAALD